MLLDYSNHCILCTWDNQKLFVNFLFICFNQCNIMRQLNSPFAFTICSNLPKKSPKLIIIRFFQFAICEEINESCDTSFNCDFYGVTVENELVCFLIYNWCNSRLNTYSYDWNSMLKVVYLLFHIDAKNVKKDNTQNMKTRKKSIAKSFPMPC